MSNALGDGSSRARFVNGVQSDGPRHEVVGRWFLKPVGKRPTLGRYLGDLWNRRHFIWADARSRALSSGRGTVLGNAWLVIQPTVNGLIYFLIFGILLATSRNVDRFIGFLIIGVFMFQFTARNLTGGATAISAGKPMIRGFTFPRAALPISVVLRETLNMLPVLGTMLVLIVIAPDVGVDGTTFSPPLATVTWRWLLFPAVFALYVILNLGAAFFTARITAQFPDFRHVVQFIRRFLFYGSGVMFSFERFVDDPQILAILKLNPLYIVFDMARNTLLYGVSPEPSSWLLLTGWAAGFLVLGFLFFWRGEERYGRE